ncbi:MAG: hypothetical protein UU72_C0037G0009 [candidate division WWE3 bacterium GW2011_GWB1_41_6]|uniref:Uncharacterized protein n=1 Tax=candidate division WWE3 bacterium GW2011_GWB1_41_6 TaxID=1619112 RepID=A0A0G0YZY6_UNCKA|nr:MAG: hypothetical protein UU72_C0037G0009 [candidate division WWE3 bacterium GW2011_GWB1_41_6]
MVEKHTVSLMKTGVFAGLFAVFCPKNQRIVSFDSIKEKKLHCFSCGF